MKLGFTTLACPGWEIDTIISRALEYGYHGVDFRGYLGEMNILEREEFAGGAEHTAAKFSKAGMEVPAFSSSVHVLHEKALSAAQREIEGYVQLCRIFGAKFIRVFGGTMPTLVPKEGTEAAARNLDRLAELGPDVTFVIETHDDFVRSEVLAAVMARVEAPNVGILWDMHHPYRMAGESPRHTLDTIGPWIKYTHVKDSKMHGDDVTYTFPGEGDVPIAEMITQLKARGYDGYLTVDWAKRPHPSLAEPEVALKAYAQFLRQYV